MKAVIVTAVALLSLGATPVVLAEPPAKVPVKELAALNQKIVGEWKGRIGCDGRLVVRADGTYEWTGYGPAANDSGGTWKVRWDTEPATLVLTCKTSEITEEVGKVTTMKLVKLTDTTLAFDRPSRDLGHYTREKK